MVLEVHKDFNKSRYGIKALLLRNAWYKWLKESISSLAQVTDRGLRGTV